MESAAALDRVFERLGVDFGGWTDPALLVDVLTADFHLGELDSFRARLGSKLTEPSPFRPLLDAIRRGLLEKHPAVCELAAVLVEEDLLPVSLDEASTTRVRRALHHMLLLEELTAAMGESVDFAAEVQTHYERKKNELGIRSNPVLAAFDMYKIVGTLFSPAKILSIDWALRYGQDASADLEVSPGELRVGRANLVVNILEAAAQDRAVGFRDNSMAGLVMAFHPHRRQRVRPLGSFMVYELSQAWVSLYATWNMAFVIGNLQNPQILMPKLFVPQVLCCAPEEFLTNRIHSLYVSTLVALFSRKQVPQGYVLPGRKTIAARWGRINLKYAQRLFRDLHGRELRGVSDLVRTLG